MAFSCLVVTNCSHPSAAPSLSGDREDAQAVSSFLGVAHLRSAGPIEVRVRLVSPQGAVGETLWTFEPSDQNYDAVWKFLGEPEPGESVSRHDWPVELLPR